MTRDADNRTTELREKLREHDVEYEPTKFSTLQTTFTANGIEWIVTEREATGELFVESRHGLTPEQAIAATVGSGTLTAEQVREAVMSADRWEKPMGSTGLTNTHLIIRDDGWQAIADELNAMLGRGTCVPHGEWERLSQTQEFRRMYCDCGYELGMDSRDSFPFARTAYAAMPRFCPECGARIVSKGKAVER